MQENTTTTRPLKNIQNDRDEITKTREQLKDSAMDIHMCMDVLNHVAVQLSKEDEQCTDEIFKVRQCLGETRLNVQEAMTVLNNVLKGLDEEYSLAESGIKDEMKKNEQNLTSQYDASHSEPDMEYNLTLDEMIAAAEERSSNDNFQHNMPRHNDLTK